MKVEYHPDTVDDLNRAYDFYEKHEKGLGADLTRSDTGCGIYGIDLIC